MSPFKWLMAAAMLCLFLATPLAAPAEIYVIEGDQQIDGPDPVVLDFRDTDEAVRRTGEEPEWVFDFSTLDPAVTTVDLGESKLYGARDDGDPETVTLDLSGADLTGRGRPAIDTRWGDGAQPDHIAIVNAGNVALGGVETWSSEGGRNAGSITIGSADRPAGEVRVGYLHAWSASRRGNAVTIFGGGDVRVADADGNPGDIRTHGGGNWHGGDVAIVHRGEFLARNIETYTVSTFGRSGWTGSIRLDGGDGAGDAAIQGDINFSAKTRNRNSPHKLDIRNYRDVRIEGSILGYSSQHYGNNVVITNIARNIEVRGEIDLERRTPGRKRSEQPENSGRLRLVAGGTVTLAGLDLNKVAHAALSSEAGPTVMDSDLIAFDTTSDGGAGTADDPLVTRQTALRAPAGSVIHYSTDDGRNSYLVPYSYKLADMDGNPGQGGILAPAPGLPGIVADEPDHDEPGTAVLAGTMVTAGTSPTVVSVYWAEGPDRGTEPEDWDHSHSWPATEGPVPATFRHTLDVEPETRYTYRFAARNESGNVWAAPRAISRIARAFDLDGIAPSRWLNDADAAISFTWDDNLPSHRRIAETFNEHDLPATFVVNPGQTESWDELKAAYRAMHKQGHEIGNHSWSHARLPRLAPDRVVSEIDRANEEIEKTIGRRPISFVHPYNQTNPEVDEIVFEHNLIARISAPHGIDDRIIFNDPREVRPAVRRVDQALEDSAWLIFGGHGMDGCGFRPIEEQVLRGILDELTGRDEDIWIDTMGAVGLYEFLRHNVRLQTTVTYNTLEIKAAGVEPERYEAAPTAPFTIILPLRRPMRADDIQCDPEHVDCRLEEDRLMVTVDLRKTQSVTVRLEP